MEDLHESLRVSFGGMTEARRAQVFDEVFGEVASAKLHNTRPRFKGRGDLWKTDAKLFQQEAGSAVAHSDPDQPGSRAGRSCQKKEILVFALHHHVIRRCAPPNCGVIRRVQSKLPDVMGNMTLVLEEPGESWRQLVINQEFHAPESTAWSA
jgi:hypothetical protein